MELTKVYIVEVDEYAYDMFGTCSGVFSSIDKAREFIELDYKNTVDYKVEEEGTWFDASLATLNKEEPSPFSPAHDKESYYSDVLDRAWTIKEYEVQ